MSDLPFPRVFPLLYTKTLETFLVVCEQRSFTKAATVLGLSQSAVSYNVLRLEETLGVVLFDREVRPIKPTNEAVLLKEKIEQQFASMAEVVSTIRQESALGPVLRAGVVESLSPNVAPELIRALAGQTNQISVLTGTSNSLAIGLIDRRLDLVVSSDPLNDLENLDRYFLFEEPHVLALPKVLARDEPWTWEALQFCGLPLVRYAQASASGKSTEGHLSRLRLNLPRRFEADTSRVVFSLVAAGIGWAITTPLCLLQCEDMVPSMCIAPLPPPTFHREIYIVTRKGESSAAARTVLDLCRAQLQQRIIASLVGIAPWTREGMKLVTEDRLDRVSV